MEEDYNDTGEQSENSRAKHLQPYQYKKGQSGNPSGRPAGISMKEYIRVKFRHMTDEEREEYLEGMSKKDILEMGEGKPKQDFEADVKATLVVEISEAIAKKNGITTTNDSSRSTK